MTAALLINRRRHVFANYQRVIARRPLLNCTVLRSAAASDWLIVSVAVSSSITRAQRHCPSALCVNSRPSNGLRLNVQCSVMVHHRSHEIGFHSRHAAMYVHTIGILVHMLVQYIVLYFNKSMTNAHDTVNKSTV